MTLLRSVAHTVPLIFKLPSDKFIILLSILPSILHIDILFAVLFSLKIILGTTLEISALWSALMCYNCNITHMFNLHCFNQGLYDILLNKFISHRKSLNRLNGLRAR